ncbi:MAG: PAS domain S-box protein [Candidatus Tectomicrobia bacterium]|uniref:histidine kinase n=1 Tax=Tectimicrobiota bacterium TaxID=2528274 RepID=A0A937W3Z1_UNCTE|nr:PAS domain S-box protein [Candidatus Tectomicrobia bacterium]
MRDARKTRAQLLQELTALRQRCAVLEAGSASPPAGFVARDPSWYRHVVEHGHGLICLHDLQGKLLFVNPAAAHVLGYEPHEGLGQPLHKFLVPETLPLFEAYLERIRQQPTDSGLMRVLTKHGVERIWSYHNTRYEEPGVPPYVLGYAQDVTERIQREQELKQARAELEQRIAERTAELQRAQERFVRAFQASPDAIILTSMDGRYIDVNPSFQRLSGYSRDEVIGRQSRELDRWVNPKERATVARVFHEKGAVYDFEARFRTKSGLIREMLLSVERIELDGAPCALTIAHDVTERRQLEREIIEISEREQQRIGYDLHDSLGQHLTGVAFLSKVLAQRLTVRQAAEAKEAAQIVEFVNQAIGQARKLARGLAPVTLEIYGLVFALQELAASVEALFHLPCQVNGDRAVHITDHAVAVHLYRIAQEAVNNAVQHGKAQRILITLATSQGGAGLDHPR